MQSASEITQCCKDRFAQFDVHVTHHACNHILHGATSAAIEKARLFVAILTSTLPFLCRRPERAFSRVDLPAPGGPSSSVNLPGCRIVLIVSRIVNRCDKSLVKPTLRSTPCKGNNTYYFKFKRVEQVQACSAHAGTTAGAVTAMDRLVTCMCSTAIDADMCCMQSSHA